MRCVPDLVLTRNSPPCKPPASSHSMRKLEIQRERLALLAHYGCTFVMLVVAFAKKWEPRTSPEWRRQARTTERTGGLGRVVLQARSSSRRETRRGFFFVVLFWQRHSLLHIHPVSEGLTVPPTNLS